MKIIKIAVDECNGCKGCVYDACGGHICECTQDICDELGECVQDNALYIFKEEE